MPDINDIAAGVPEDPNAPMGDYGKRGAYMPAVLPNGEVWEGYVKDEIFEPVEKMDEAGRLEELLHVDENYRVIRSEPEAPKTPEAPEYPSAPEVPNTPMSGQGPMGPTATPGY